jgi:glycosyltransferase involved in cell wall biosynthesis
MALDGRRVLFISYNGMLDPLGQTQVLPYLRELAKKGVRFTLLSFERSKAFEMEGAEKCRHLQRQLISQGIEWHWLRYHQKPSLPATAYDVMAGVRHASKLVRRNQIEMVHARSHIPATIALVLKKRFGIKMIFDVRGLMAEEYVDAEHWRKGSVAYRLTKAVEQRALAASDAIVTLTERIWPIIKEWKGLRGREVNHEVIPCCVDLSMFQSSVGDRVRRRTELELGNRFTLVYCGSIDGWYLTEKMADFFANLFIRNPKAHFLWLTMGSQQRIGALMNERGIPASNFSVRSVASEEVPSYLAASDAGIAFIKPSFSKLASSPTKNAEYLACGLPIVINAGVGDSDALATEFNVGVLVNEFNAAEYEKAAAAMEKMGDNPDGRTITRAVAEKLFDLRIVGAARYAMLYERVLSRNSASPCVP